MTEFQKISLSDALNELGEGAVNKTLSSFSSPKNNDIESFLKNKAISFAMQNIAPTTLVYACDKNEWKLCGYFTLTIKTIEIDRANVSSDLFKRVKKFGAYDKERNMCTIPAPLIAQLGKNYGNGYNRLIDGSELLKIACDEVRKAQYILGGKIVYLECEDAKKLKDFYGKNGFREFSQRPLDDDERRSFEKHYLVQMLKYLN